MTERQGKCAHCAVRWRWIGAPRLKDACCPSCGRRLQRTTHLLRWPVRYGEGRGRPRTLQAMAWVKLLARDPAAALADAQRRRVQHVERQHGNGCWPEGCPTCRLIGNEIDHAHSRLSVPVTNP